MPELLNTFKSGTLESFGSKPKNPSDTNLQDNGKIIFIISAKCCIQCKRLNILHLFPCEICENFSTDLSVLSKSKTISSNICYLSFQKGLVWKNFTKLSILATWNITIVKSLIELLDTLKSRIPKPNPAESFGTYNTWILGNPILPNPWKSRTPESFGIQSSRMLGNPEHLNPLKQDSRMLWNTILWNPFRTRTSENFWT